MSLTNIVYTPVDTGTAKISFKVENAKRIFYKRAGAHNVIETGHACLCYKKDT